jgi:hypothetical protein
MHVREASISHAASSFLTFVHGFQLNLSTDSYSTPLGEHITMSPPRHHPIFALSLLCVILQSVAITAYSAFNHPFNGPTLTVLTGAMATGEILKLPIREGAGIESTNDQKKKNDTEQTQVQDCPSEPMLCSDTNCGGNVRI